MIKKENRFDHNAYRVTFDLDPSVTKLEEGQSVSLNDSGKLVIADGTKKSYVAMGSKRAKRDQVTGLPVQKIAVLVGSAILSISNIDATQTYKAGSPLKVKADGVLTLADPDNASTPDKAHKIVGYAHGPLSPSGFLRVEFI
ncbi:MAG: hypothetical protein RR420_00820 [Anaerovoracaceae bacterium]